MLSGSPILLNSRPLLQPGTMTNNLIGQTDGNTAGIYANKSDNFLAQAIVCTKCKKTFKSQKYLTSHMNKKTACDVAITCNICNKQFKQNCLLKKHRLRKTSCAPIHGDPTMAAGLNVCIFCRKKLSDRQSLVRHLGVCKIKNGGMLVLFEEVKKTVDAQTKEVKHLREKIKQLEEQPTHQGVAGTAVANVDPTGGNTANCGGNAANGGGNTINIDNIVNGDNIVNNHFNTTFNFNMVDFGDGIDTIQEIMDKNALKILEEKYNEDIPHADQISDRVVNLVGLAFRNPDHKELQGAYVLDLAKPKDNAFYHEDGKWKLTDWTLLRSNLLQILFNCLSRTRENKKKDIMNIIKYLFVLGDCGNTNVKKLNDDETLQIHKNIGEHMKFETIAN